MSARIEASKQRMAGIMSAASPVDREDFMRLFAESLVDVRRTMDSVHDSLSKVLPSVVLSQPCHCSLPVMLLTPCVQLLAAYAAESRERSQRLNELFASQVEVLLRCRSRLTRIQAEVKREESTFGDGSAAGK